VCLSEAGFTDSAVLFDGADDESPLSCAGGGGCRGCLLGCGVNTRPFGVDSLPGWCESEAVQVDARGREGCPCLLDSVVGGGGSSGGGVGLGVRGGCVVAVVLCRGGFWGVVVVGLPLEYLDRVGVGIPLLLLLLAPGVVVVVVAVGVAFAG